MDNNPGPPAFGPLYVGWRLLVRMAALAFVFVILVGTGSAWIAIAVFLPLPQVVTVVVQILGYGLQIFAAIWFIALAVGAWHFFTKADSPAWAERRATHAT
jgi:hypothetical protein